MDASLYQRQLGLEAWRMGEDMAAVQHFRRSAVGFLYGSLEWAISERLHGLALIRVQREVEGTFCLERADAVLEGFGIAPFDAENIPSVRLELMKPSLLVVLAHPDDEAFSSGAILTHYAKLGVRVELLCATRGEAGKITDPNLSVADLGKQRELELRRACAAMGINEPRFMDYHDSGRLERLRRDDPLATINIDYLEIEQKILAVVRETKPQVLLTFDPHGGYNHPDHLSVHRATTAAFFSSGHLEYPPQRLFYTAISLEQMREWISLPGGAMTPGMTPEVYGVSDDTLAVRFDGSAYLDSKMAAIAAHGTQTGENSRMGQLPPEQREAMQKRMALENFALGGTRGAIMNYPLKGFFDGLGLEIANLQLE
jgi:N-acetyl-1-D-myo-inositol-2-amino-2-deoxy-alpha-D-glucopyranoside deacetylase